MKFFAVLLLSCALVLASGNDVVEEYMNMEHDSNYVLDDETEMVLDLINRPITPSRYKAEDFFDTWVCSDKPFKLFFYYLRSPIVRVAVFLE